jgi:hypothetical protein
MLPGGFSTSPFSGMLKNCNLSRNGGLYTVQMSIERPLEGFEMSFETGTYSLLPKEKCTKSRYPIVKKLPKGQKNVGLSGAYKSL